jgi:hypothetical protein
MIEAAVQLLASEARTALSVRRASMPLIQLPVPPIRSASIMLELTKLLRIHTPNFAMPVPIDSTSDMDFIIRNNYRVSLKADGVRAWLIRFDDKNVYIRHRDNSLILYDDSGYCAADNDACAIPPRTVVDVEMMPDGSALAFDLLACRGELVWHKRLDHRLMDLQQMLLECQNINDRQPISSRATVV